MRYFKGIMILGITMHELRLNFKRKVSPRFYEYGLDHSIWITDPYKII